METIEKKAIENWKVDRKIFDNLNVGDLLSGNTIVTYVDKKENLIATCQRNESSKNSINDIMYGWDKNFKRPNLEASSVLYKYDNFDYKRKAYQKLDTILTEAGL
jgi:hypothetical protein